MDCIYSTLSRLIHKLLPSFRKFEICYFILQLQYITEINTAISHQQRGLHFQKNTAIGKTGRFGVRGTAAAVNTCQTLTKLPISSLNTKDTKH